MLLQLLDEDGQPLPDYEVAADPVGAGVGEWVLVTRGSAARIESHSQNCPLDAMVVAIIDTVNVQDRSLYRKKDHY